MTIGVALPSGDTANTGNIVDELVTQTGQAAEAGLTSAWFSQQTEHDAITVAAIAGRAVPGITVGTGVVPIYPRHPLLIAGSAQTAQAAAGGRFVLGLGTGAKNWLEPTYGVEFPPPIKHLREYLTILRQVLDGDEVDFQGETVSAHAKGFAVSVSVAGSSDLPLIVAAMGRQALRVTGELADGTIPFLAGPKALSELIVPEITKAAVGRPAPRIIAMVPVVVTEDPEAVRAIVDRQYAFFRDIPSYRAIFDAQGVDSAGDLVIAGDEETVAAEIRRYFDAGATEVVATQSGTRNSEERLRTWRVLGDLVKR
ncbi:TIGR03564 family F420-dependent LLM class oxidoreductase [Amycolatopsis regifaucium]|uniref:LLM class F420-dependent oxidoreductase n=1 Tax=Amycolatopsis regifaucium TaxID=546365 RepID=A0A154MMF8_9PSEU|nr:TIGR03564 family F420-dependent LLM class oxidoreductase [Amycolatopsis regifaucium]KZB85123.1 LLM class F420-dependent oxidoreductase [Amycolatopsis regifaucium]OKA04244.1 LLM class F420-dependent oxidoreductase [Amycolatopsis regifaucium]SFH93188.1 F420-dependent oxidoreductase, MSMEG_4879 family [Amycolatopsis regifaucium]